MPQRLLDAIDGPRLASTDLGATTYSFRMTLPDEVDGRGGNRALVGGVQLDELAPRVRHALACSPARVAVKS